MSAGATYKKANDAQRAVRMVVGRGVISAIDDSKKAQAVQLELLDDEAIDGVEHFQGYGFTSVPLPGAEAVVACAGGVRGHAIVVGVVDRRYRLTGLQGGEVAIHDDQGQKILLGRDGVVIETGKPITVRGQKVLIEADAVDLAAEGGQAVARVGDDVDLSTGKILSGSDKVKAA